MSRVVTSVDIDHVDYLGPTRDDIGREKAGIFRPARPAICGESDPPATLVATARDIGATPEFAADCPIQQLLEHLQLVLRQVEDDPIGSIWVTVTRALASDVVELAVDGAGTARSPTET